MTVTAIPNAPEQAADKKTQDGKAGKAGKKGGRKKLVLLLVGVLALGAGAYVTVLKPKPSGPPVAGEVVKLDPIQINLASDHYLRIGLALQLVKGAKEADGSKALDATIGVFSGLAMSEVNDPEHRELLRKQLVKELEERYEGGVMGVYFTELVTQ